MAATRAIARATGAWLAFVVATGLVVVLFDGAEVTLAVRVGRALVVLVVVLAVLAVLHRSRRELVAVHRPGFVVVGAAVVLASALATFGTDALLGGTRVVAVDPARFLTFLLVTVLVAGAQEAVPEELALRGAAFGSLREVLPTYAAAAAVTVAFVVAPGAGISLGHLVLGRAPAFAPAGTDPAAYAVLLAVFGTMLVVARIATGSVWTCVGAHLCFLVVNRTVLGDGSGVVVEAPPGAELLVLVYLLLATAAFAIIGRRRRGTPRETPHP